MKKSLYQIVKINVLLLCLVVQTGCSSANIKSEQEVIPITASVAIRDIATTTPSPTLPAISSPTVAAPKSPTILTTAAPTMTSNNDWTSRWLKGIPCKLPCFEGITPGITTMQEGVEILKKHPQVGNQSFRYDNFPNALIPLLNSRKDYTLISWTWTGIEINKSGGSGADSWSIAISVTGSFTFYNDDAKKIIRSVGTGLQKTATFEEIQSAFGDPDYVYAKSEPKTNKFISRSLILYYLKNGFLAFYEDDVNKPIVFTKTSPFGPPDTVFAPGLVGYQNNIVYDYAIPVNELLPWEGLKSFEYYCEKNMKRKCE